VNLHNCFSTVDQWHREGSLRYWFEPFALTL
jgi:hypothetical protein